MVLMVVVEEAVQIFLPVLLVMVVGLVEQVKKIQLAAAGVALLYIATLILLFLDQLVMVVLHQDLRVEMVVFLAEAAEVLLIMAPA
jgi:hypothetical protein